PEDLDDANPQRAQLVSGLAILCEGAIERARADSRPPPMIALAFTKADDYGPAVRRTRLVTTPAALAAQLALARDDAGDQAQAQAAWNRFLAAVQPDPVALRLLRHTQRLWEGVGRQTRFFNSY